jgi:hypothetical protein
VRGGVRAPGRRQREGCIEVYSYWKHWSCVFPQHGPGRKHERHIRLVPWQEQIVERYPGAVLRGLLHSDGCRVLNRANGYVYPRHQFSNRSDDIRDIFCRACDLLGVDWKLSNAVTISVSTRSSVEKLDRIIGSKH